MQNTFLGLDVTHSTIVKKIHILFTDDAEN